MTDPGAGQPPVAGRADRLHLSPKHREILETLLREHLPEIEVWAYGSRVNDHSHDGSDLDLVLRAPGLQEIPIGPLTDFTEALHNSTLPFLVEARDWARLPERFHKEIERGYVVIQNKASKDGADSSSNWREVLFGDCAELIRDSVSPSVMGNALYIGLEHIGAGTLTLAGQGLASHVTSTKKRFWRGNILFGKLRPYFRKVVRAPADGICSTDIWVVRAKNGVNQDYLYYRMASQQFVDFATAGSEGTKMPRAVWEHVSRYNMSLPPLPEQHAIAHILGTLDDKIELNRRMNETLEAMVRAVFKDWFVDFDPVRAKMEGRWRPGESLPGLPAHLYDLFPDRLVESELGEIPEGWEVGTVDKLATVVGGTTPSTKNIRYWQGGNHHWATPRDLASLSTPVLLHTERQITDAGLAKISSGLLPQGSILLSSRAPIGYLAIAEIPVAINQGFIGILPREGISNLFMLYWSKASNEEIVSYANGSTFLEINKGNFRRIPLVTPDEIVITMFDRWVRPLYECIVSNEHESRIVATIRNTLLPKLVPGEWRIGNLETLSNESI